MIRSFIFCLTCLLCTSILRAELPPSAYEQMQKKAPTVLEIHVLQADQRKDKDSNGEQTQVDLMAEVLKVLRKESTIQPGELISIQYTLEKRPAVWAGPGQVPVLAEGIKTIAYLKKKGTGAPIYEPAAGRMSFSRFGALPNASPSNSPTPTPSPNKPSS